MKGKLLLLDGATGTELNRRGVAAAREAVTAGGEGPGCELRSGSHSGQTAHRIAGGLRPRFSAHRLWDHWLCRRSAGLDQHGRQEPGELLANCSNLADANCGRLLWHHAGTYSQTKSWEKAYDMNQNHRTRRALARFTIALTAALLFARSSAMPMPTITSPVPTPAATDPIRTQSPSIRSSPLTPPASPPT